MNNSPEIKSSLPAWPSVQHYYGDVVRAIFVGAAVVIGVFAPMSGSVGFSVAIAAPIVLVLIALAGFTNPHSKVVMVLDTVAAVVCFMFTETFAVVAYNSHDLFSFVVLEVLSVVLLFALYFSAKTLRAAMLGKIGKIDGVGEFDTQ